MKVLLDTNILIYSSDPNYIELRHWLEQQVLIISQITRLEILGYHKLNDKEESYLNQFIKYCTIWPIDNTVIEGQLRLDKLNQ